MDFQKDVLDRSYSIPILVDFWAPWCGPCRVLGPVLKSLAEEQKGKWDLVKVNTEEHPDLASRYQVMSIPNVKLFYKGEVIGEFVGALPKVSIQNWLKSKLPDEETQGLENILESAEEWPAPGIIPELQTFLQAHPDHKEAHIALAREQILDDPETAMERIRELQHEDTVEDLKALGELLLLEENGSGDVPDSLAEAAVALKNRDFDTAAQSIIRAVQTDKAMFSELPRRAGVALFRLLGAGHPVVRSHRRLFDMMLD